ncbi:PilN domain-containing protein [Candidatus Woesebacteria bacterium]|nr:PilN domain-containing protein [Candidatus Woesebacteria bacterium]MCD8506938.1 PilN domain-containing protein [Candidatus Woesebacteria bacterium]MCD8527228.1 PilN domain-containing protein [Candidatus Woesebacteria bacterium]MCD8546594.1 PilN domain-containing protein [Candidatus Woesebacteria bacterium]
MPSLISSLPFLSSGKKAGLQIPSLNLYPEDPFYATPIGKILRWAVSIGRHIVIFTEVIVIVSFFSRFTLDRQLTDLNRSIIQKQAIVESYDTLEADVREVQEQTDDIAAILDQQGRYEVMAILQRVTPSDVVYDQISLRREKLNISGTIRSNRSLEVFVDRLKQVPEFESVSITNIQSGDVRDPGITFGVSLTYSRGLAEVLQEE